ncbi:MAG: hypothetical protein Q8N04_07730 [Nitrospira sp.]|nr:hypothetical protein [Nitrospira sp.]
MKPIPVSVRFCVGCGYFCDAIQPEGEQAPWIDAHAYLMKYGLHWDDLDRVDDTCPPCARVLACARRGAVSETQGERTCALIGQE